MIEIDSLYEFLVEASFRGVRFSMPDSRDESGRRVQRIFFPGRDDTAFQDLGALDGDIRVSGLVHGDDYVGHAAALRTAFRTSGPGLLVHPWLGQMVVILTGPVSISFDWSERRIARFQATFARYYPPSPPSPDTLSGVTHAFQDLQTQAQNLLAAFLSPIAVTVAVIGAVEGFCSQVAGIWAGAVSVASAIAGAASVAIATLDNVEAFVTDADYPAAIGAALTAPSAAIVNASATLVAAAIGPGDIAPPAAPVDPRVTTAALLSAQAQILALAGSPGSIGALVLAAASFALADAFNAATDIVFTSQQDAQNWLSQLLVAADATATLATVLAPSQPVAAGMVWRSVQGLRGAASVDISAAIGRLPTVQSLTLLTSVPVWLIAQGLAGDTPGNVLASYNDLVARNAIRNPALAGPGSIEALVA